jgi:galactokinase
MTEAEAHAKRATYDAVQARLRSLNPRTEPAAFWVPGRIEVLGKHTDYAGGRSLLCTTERGFCVVAAGRTDSLVRIFDEQRGLEHAFELASDLSVASASWPVYAMTVARRLTRNFPRSRTGAEIVLSSDLPPSSGMSSSSALVIATFLALAHVNALERTPEYQQNIRCNEDLAGYIACIENGSDFGSLTGDRGVGTFGGSEDHTAILCCQAGNLAQYRFCPVRHERTIPLPAEFTFAVAFSGVAAHKTGNALDQYNRLSLAVRKIVELWNGSSGRRDSTLAAAVASAPDAADRLRDILRASHHRDFSPADLLDRFNQFMAENYEIIPAASEALTKSDVVRFGDFVDRSERGAEQLLRNQVPETIALARSARELGALAASAFGAGFGGSVWALIATSAAPDFLTRWSRQYRADFPARASASSFFLTHPGPPATKLS